MIRLKPVKGGHSIFIINDRRSLPMIFLTRVIIRDFKTRKLSLPGEGGEFILQAPSKEALLKVLDMIPKKMYRDVTEMGENPVPSTYEPTEENTWNMILRKHGSFWVIIKEKALPYFSRSRDFRLLVQTYRRDLYAII